MDINIKASQYQPVAVAPPKPDNNSRPAETSDVSLKVVASPAVEKPTKPQYSENDLQQAVKQLNNFVQTTNRSLQFSVDNDSGTLVTKVVDAETDKVIWQMPTEDAIKLAESLTSLMKDGKINIFNSKA
jgi:flagellar protein FlaG